MKYVIIDYVRYMTQRLSELVGLKESITKLIQGRDYVEQWFHDIEMKRRFPRVSYFWHVHWYTHRNPVDRNGTMNYTSMNSSN